MWVAYAIPKEDHHLLVEDGLGLVETGTTQEEAEAKVRTAFEKEQDEMTEQARKHGYTDDGPRLQFDDCYVLHANQV